MLVSQWSMSNARSRAFTLVSAFALTLLAAACSPPSSTPASSAPATENSTATSGIDLAGMDRAVNPGDDFFRFANGTWERGTSIPDDRSTWGVTAEIAQQVQQHDPGHRHPRPGDGDKAQYRRGKMLQGKGQSPKGRQAQKAPGIGWAERAMGGHGSAMGRAMGRIGNRTVNWMASRIAGRVSRRVIERGIGSRGLRPPRPPPRPGLASARARPRWRT